MIIEYQRPKTIKDALELLSREQPHTIPLGGGSVVNTSKADDIAVVDLQALNLGGMSLKGTDYELGATATLSEIDVFLKKDAFTEAISIQAGKNLRNSGTIAGMICSSDGKSPLLTLLLAMDARLVWEPGSREISLGDWLPLRGENNEGKLITKVIVPDVAVRFTSIGRSPKDQPVICCAIARWTSKRVRVAMGGFAKIPTLVLDGREDDDLEVAIKSALHEASDQWASAEYRIEAGTRIARRLFDDLVQ